MERPSQGVQLLGSLLAALAIAAVAVAVVTAKFGPTSSAERELQEQRIEQREEAIEERQELLEERLEQGR
jgi:bifunctional ADP-heptose synthase (sugar kinase/adenylyltransferase)